MQEQLVVVLESPVQMDGHQPVELESEQLQAVAGGPGIMNME